MSPQGLSKALEPCLQYLITDTLIFEKVRGKLFEDAVGFAGTPLSITNQTIGNVTNEFEPFQHDGIIGYGGPGWSATGRKSFFQNLCDAGKLPSCQFGMTLRHDGTGEQTLGGVDPRYASKLSVAPVAELGPWSIYGDVVVGNQVVARDQTMILDSGTTVVFGYVVFSLPSSKLCSRCYIQDGSSLWAAQVRSVGIP